MNKEELYTNIEEYLSGHLSGDSLTNFEKLLSTDPKFADEVALHRSVQEGFGDPQKRVLRESLDVMREEFKNTAPEKETKVMVMGAQRQQRIMWMAAASILLIGLTWWFLLRNPVDKNELVQDPTIEKQDQKAPENVEEPTNKKVIPIPEKKEDYVKEDSPIKTEPDPKETPQMTPPSIDYYQPNTELASLIDNLKRHKTHRFEIQVPAANETLTATNGNVALYFKGVLQSFDFPETEKFSLSIYNNQPGSYQKNSTVFRSDIVFEKVEEVAFAGEDFTFKVDESVKLRSGLYYYLIRLENEVLAGGSFGVE